jgi:biopolymer transport protein ExbB
MAAENYFDEYVLQGGITMIALFPLSIFTFGLVLQKFRELKEKSVIPKELVAQAMAVNSDESFNQFRTQLTTNPSPLAEIILDYIEAGERGEPITPDENTDPIDFQADLLYHSLTPISTAYIVAPLLGVLGTTVGIMGTFEQFAIAGKRDMSALVAAIDKSLITTMWGLIIAVPAYYSFSLLQSKIFKYERRTLPNLLKSITKHLAPYIKKREQN